MSSIKKTKLKKLINIAVCNYVGDIGKIEMQAMFMVTFCVKQNTHLYALLFFKAAESNNVLKEGNKDFTFGEAVTTNHGITAFIPAVALISSCCVLDVDKFNLSK